MIKNYLKIAFRNMARYKFISFINLFGLTIGMTCCLLILSYIIHELSYDKYNSKADRIYRVTRSFSNREGAVTLHLGAVAPPFAPLLKNEFPDIEAVTRILPMNSPVRYENKIFNEKELFFADDKFSTLFDLSMLKGDSRTGLKDAYSVMMTEDLAKKYFGNEDPMNKVIRLDDQFNFKVTGIYKDFPENAQMHPKMLLSFSTLNDSALYGEKQLMTNWGNNAFYTYLLFPKDYPVKNIEARFSDFLDKYMQAPGAPAGYKPSKYTALYLQQLTDIHLHSHLDEEIEENGDVHRVYIFGAIALFILLIACINYMNLSTARSTLRAREIGIRKVSGALRSEIITQFLSESVLITWLAILLAIVFTALCLPWLNAATGQHLSINGLLQWQIILPLALTPFVIGILSGLYPALFMSSFQPVKVLKGLIKVGGGSISFRKVLVVTQFSISIILIISTAIVFQQLNYIQQASLGIDKDQVVLLNNPDGLKNFESFRSALLQNPGIREIARSSRVPSGRLLDEDGAAIEKGDSLEPVKADIKALVVDYGFVPAYGIRMVAGRNFSREFATDSTSFMLNEAATRTLGFTHPQDAVGKSFRYGSTKGKIVGIMADFHFESMHQQILPIAFAMPTPSGGPSFARFSVKLNGNVKAALDHLEKTWKQYVPQAPFEYSFLDEKFEELYKTEQQQGTLFTTFACIAIFIACLGLFGLSAFTISQRVKEIGVRKVLGASVGSIVNLLSRDFLKLIAIAALIAFPIAWFAMYNWLQGFAYRISIQWWVFLAAGILAAAVALVTIGIQAIKAALANPVESLRSE